ncbi:Rhodanese-like domain-containing protein [Phlyctochytrium arcticum]|nr:Rhodanese-like domain-containing protein [Phlyctochytrium arcticum]
MASSSLVSPLPPVSPSSLQASSRDYFSMVTRASTTQQQQQHHSLPLETPYYTPMPFPQTPFFSGSSSSSSSASPNTTTGIRTTTTTTLLTPAAHQPPPGTLNLTNTPSLSSTSSTPAAPTETMAEFTPDQLAQLLVAQQKQQQQKLLILDMRMYNQYSSSRITSAVNVCIPTTLLKRPALKPDKLFDTLGSDHAKSILKDWSTADLLVLYDDSTFLGPLSPLSLLSKKLLLSSSASGPRVAWLKGGFTAFQQSHPSLCESSVQGMYL